MDFLLETNPAFLIIPINTTEFVFYNSREFGIRNTIKS